MLEPFCRNGKRHVKTWPQTKDLRFLNPRLLQGHPSPEFATSEFAAAGAKARPRGRGRFKKCVVADGEGGEGENDGEALESI